MLLPSAQEFSHLNVTGEDAHFITGGAKGKYERQSVCI